MGYLFRGGLEDDVRSVGSAIDDAVIQPIVDNPAAVIGIGLNFMAPGLGTAIGTALGATGATAAVVGGAVIGGATAELTGGNFVQGAIGGGLGAGLGQLAQGAGGTVAGNAADMTVQTAEQLGQGFENTMSAAGYQPVGSAIADALAPAPAPEVVAPAPAPEVLAPVPVPDANAMGPMTADQLGQGFQNTMDAAGYQPVGSVIADAVAPAAPTPTPEAVAPTPTMGPGYYDEITGQYIQDPNGGLQAPLTPESGTADMSNWTVDPTKGSWSNSATGEVFNGVPGSLDPWNPAATGQTGGQIMANAGAQPTTSTTSTANTNNLVKQLLGAGATTAGTASGLLGTGAPTSSTGAAGEDQIFGKATQSKYSFDQQVPQYTPQSLMTISQLLGRR